MGFRLASIASVNLEKASVLVKPKFIMLYKVAKWHLYRFQNITFYKETSIAAAGVEAGVFMDWSNSSSSSSSWSPS